MADGFFSWLRSEAGQMAIAGAAGGVVRWLTLRERIREGMVSVVVGGISASYLGPLAQPLLVPIIGEFVVAPEAQIGFSSFIVGLLGVGITGFVLDIWRARKRQINGGSDGPRDAAP